ncbi:hypothetical protein BH18THE2_BH18THE2_26240 [soil metagenome]
MNYKTLKMIAVSEENYLALKKLGSAGDSFNDVVTEVLKEIDNKRRLSQTVQRVDRSNRSVIAARPKTALESDSSHER